MDGQSMWGNLPVPARLSHGAAISSGYQRQPESSSSEPITGFASCPALPLPGAKTISTFHEFQRTVPYRYHRLHQQQPQHQSAPPLAPLLPAFNGLHPEIPPSLPSDAHKHPSIEGTRNGQPLATAFSGWPLSNLQTAE